ncbi:uncharacterized protein LOC143030951 [Oratosquilla oratoria]|uniref:uncharacterized protein LOC143030951 n=1 Tax=Oratosquilla oratoria TaxID=337810 RepID=UPI003F77425C
MSYLHFPPLGQLMTLRLLFTFLDMASKQHDGDFTLSEEDLWMPHHVPAWVWFKDTCMNQFGYPNDSADEKHVESEETSEDECPEQAGNKDWLYRYLAYHNLVEWCWQGLSK